MKLHSAWKRLHSLSLILAAALLAAPPAGAGDEKAISAVLKLGGIIERDDKKPGCRVVIVRLGFKKVSDADLKTIAGFKKLRYLDISGGTVTNAGLAQLTGLTELETLELGSSIRLNDAGMKELKNFPNLVALTLSYVPLTDGGLKQVAKLKQLQKLYISNTRITDAGLKDVASLTELKVLGLASTSVSDAGLKELAALKRLETVYLSKTKVTDAGVNELTKALPKVRIIRKK